jgi:hypothetical protein
MRFIELHWKKNFVEISLLPLRVYEGQIFFFIFRRTCHTSSVQYEVLIS